MPLLFSYGTLQQVEVQLSLFGRPLAGRPDALAGCTLSSVAIDDPALVASYGRTHNANVVPGNGRVSGTVFEVTEAELAAADVYENADDYRRTLRRLESGSEAWVYAWDPNAR